MSGPRFSSRFAAAAVGIALATAPAANAATQVGETFTPSGTFCGGNFTSFQTNSVANSYVFPFSGVITAWRYEANATGPAGGLKLKVGRLVPPPITIRIVGESTLEIPALSTTTTFLTRVPVAADDILGTYSPSSAQCKRPATGFFRMFAGGDQALGTSTPYGNDPGNPVQLDIAATLETDSDGDGYGDETQDLCPSDASVQGACPDRANPQVVITKRPKEKTKKKRATFEFSGTDPRALAGFECSLDGAPFSSCTSPLTVTVKKGAHTFAVQAVDQAGNRGSAVTADWTVKKKRKK